MFRSLHSRLLLSYLAVVLAALTLITLVLLGLSARPQFRLQQHIMDLDQWAQAVVVRLNRLPSGQSGAEQLDVIMREVAEETGFRMMLVAAPNAEIVYDSHNGQWLNHRLAPEKLDAIQLQSLNVQQAGVYNYEAEDGERWVLYLAPIPRFPNAVVTLAAPDVPPFEIFRTIFARPLLVGSGLALVLSLLLSYAISRSVAQPLQRMATAATAIAQGDYDQQVPMAGPQEVRAVARDFNQMAQQVKVTQQAQRDFLANVSHDLKTPLTSIRGWSQAISDETLNDEAAVRQASQIIEDEATRMTRMVQQLLDLAKLDSGQVELRREPVDMAVLLHEIRNRFALRAEQNEVLLAVSADPPLHAHIDYDRTMQIFANLVDNALEHTPHGGQIELVAERQPTAISVRVRDSGAGIPEDELARIFERFYQVDKSRVRSAENRGTGLGLSIVAQLVQAHDGQLDVSSTIGVGTTFTVQLPAASSAAVST